MLKRINTKTYLQIILIAFAFILLIVLMSNVLPPAVDWHGAFRPAALEILNGRSPYNADGFFNPPWAAILLIPFAIFPEQIGRAALVIVALIAYVYISHKLGARKIVTLFLLLSPPVMHGIVNGNIDWLAALGFVMPVWLSLFFLMIKPQVGLAVAIFLFISTWREGGIKKVIKNFTPFGVVFTLSVFIFGPWFLSISQDINLAGNASLWPLSLPIGVVFLVSAIQKDEIKYSMIASPFLSPYVIFHSWIGPFLALSAMTFEAIAAVLGMWIVVYLRIRQIN